MDIFAKFDQQGICRSLIRTSDSSFVVPPDFEEIKDEDLKKTILPNHHKKLNGKIVKMSVKEKDDATISSVPIPNPIDRTALLEKRIAKLEEAQNKLK